MVSIVEMGGRHKRKGTKLNSKDPKAPIYSVTAKIVSSVTIEGPPERVSDMVPMSTESPILTAWPMTMETIHEVMGATPSLSVLEIMVDVQSHIQPTGLVTTPPIGPSVIANHS